MTAIDGLGFTRDFEPGGKLDTLQPQPWHRAEVDRVRLALNRMACAADPALDDFDEDGRAGERFYLNAARAVLEVDREASELVGSKARTEMDWAEVCATPGKGHDRRLLMLRIGGKLLHHGVPDLMVLFLLLGHNRSLCIPPLMVPEVELLWQDLCSKREAQR